MAPEVSPVEKLRRRARVGLGAKLTAPEVAYIVNLVLRQNVSIQTLRGLVSEYERLLKGAEGDEEE